MTGKDLIIYILQNNFEHNDIEYIMNSKFVTADELALKFKVGAETIKVWYKLNLIPGFMFGEILYLFADSTDPREGK